MSRTTEKAGTTETAGAAAEGAGSVAAEGLPAAGGSAEAAGSAAARGSGAAGSAGKGSSAAAGSVKKPGKPETVGADEGAEGSRSTGAAGAAGAAGSGEAAEVAGPSAEASGAADAARSAEGGDEIEVRDHISVPDADGKPVRGTRRFPMFTKDTARPEGGGRAAPREAPAPVRQWPILAVLSTVGLGLLLTALDAFRIGTILIGVALLAGAALRWAVRDVGMLAVRSRFTDMATYIFLGTAIVLLALMAQPKPWLEIPFLKDTLHFTVGDEETG